jgi:hypothetical protein
MPSFLSNNPTADDFIKAASYFEKRAQKIESARGDRWGWANDLFEKARIFFEVSLTM